MLTGTPLHPRTSPLCEAQNWRRWAGYLAAGSYELTHEREYWAIRSTAGLIDVSPLYKYLIRGPGATRFLDRVMTRNVARCEVGQVLYTPWCDDAGKVIDDGTLARLGPDVYRLTSAEPNLLWLSDNVAGLSVEIEDVSDTTAALALQGPSSRRILAELADTDISDIRFFRSAETSLGGIPVTVTRTGYTGDLGYEIFVDSGDAIDLWDRLIQAGDPHGILPAGLLALDVARIEAGLVLITVDYVPTHHARIEDQKSSPFELGLGWTVDVGKEYFVGREALIAEQRAGPKWTLTGLEIAWESFEAAHAEAGLPPQLPGAAWRTSVPVYSGSRQVGYATSGCWSPILKKYIALAHVRAPHGAPGGKLDVEVTVEHRRRRARATTVRTPFFDPARKRA